MDTCPVCEKEYDQKPLMPFNKEEIEDLKTQVSEFLANKFDFILIKTSQEMDKKPDSAEGGVIKYFQVGAAKEPIYLNLRTANELNDLVDRIINLAREMEQTINGLLDDYDGKIEKDLFESVQLIWKLIGRFIKQLEKQKSKLKIADDSDTEKMQYQLYEFIRKNFDAYLLDRIIPPIFEGMKGGNIPVYESILKHINEFLSHLGITTIELKENQDIDYDLCEPIEAQDNETDDYKLKNCIKKVIQLPYVFDLNHIVKEGKIVGWRFSG
ncbi:MAG: hypothetical protein ACMUJM_22905 [bacterium]